MSTGSDLRVCCRIAVAVSVAAALGIVEWSVSLHAVSPDIVISQVYGGGGNAGATYRNDFIELYNRGSVAVDLASWSVQYASATGTTWQRTLLTGTLQPNHYFLVQEAQGAGGTTDLPAPDAIGTIAMAAGAGKVALLNTTTVLSGACPAVASITDFVGYGTTANCFEGTGPTPSLSNTTAALRINDGNTDTDNNAGDFVVGAPNPRSSSVVVVPPPFEPIHAIQGTASMSPFVGQRITTEGIVTGVKANGFFIQTPDSQIDADPNTSEGVFVFTSSAPPAAAAVGNDVQVTGTVQEFVPAADPQSPPTTEIGSPTVVTLSTGNPLPAPITLTLAEPSPDRGIEQLEKYEGMRVHVDALKVIAPTGGTVLEASASSTSNGVFYGVIPGNARPFREPGVELPDALPPGAPANVPRYDANPERIRVDSDALTGATRLEVTTGALVTNLTGPLDYSFRSYMIDPEPTTVPTVSGNITAIPVDAPEAREFTVASFNMERFFDTDNDPDKDDVALTPAAYETRLAKASLAIRNVLRMPDIVGVEEMENLATLQAVAARVSADALGSGQPDPQYQAILIEGNDIGGIDVGFLVKGAESAPGVSRVAILDALQFGKDATYINPIKGQPELLNDRPSVLMHAVVQVPGGVPFPATVIVNHLRSLSGVDDPTDGVRVRAKRRAQAEYLANYVQALQAASPGEHIILVGDFNAFQFNDGYVDVIGTIKGQPTQADQVVLASDDLVNPDLVDLVESVPADQRYSFVFDGVAQELDHVLVTGNVTPFVSRFEYARNDADFPESYRGDASRPERISDHDMVVAYFAVPLVSTVTYTGDTNVEAGSDLHLAANVIGPSTGTIVFTIDTMPPHVLSAPIVGGTATATLPHITSLGTFTVTASFAGDSVYAPSSTAATVTVSDTTPPTITSVTPSATSLWPPNKRMAPVTIAVNAVDVVDTHPVCRVSKVSANEGSSADWSIASADTVLLRADRNGAGSGRVYSVTIACRDASGNVAAGTTRIVVPHDAR
jgi:uncharacterized protein